MVLYIWMNCLFLLSIFDLLSWFTFLVLPKLRYTFIAQRLPMQHGQTAVRTGMHAFVYDYLQHDGFLILRLVQSNAGDDVTSMILIHLWTNFQRLDKSSTSTNTITNIGATISLTATGNSHPDGSSRSIFDYTETMSEL
jgi:hypothetical protein